LLIPFNYGEFNQALSENSIVGPRASGFSPGKDGKAGDIGFIVDAAGCSQADNKPLEARSSFLTEPNNESAYLGHIL
jgi:hypothetical protein